MHTQTLFPYKKFYINEWEEGRRTAAGGEGGGDVPIKPGKS